VFLLLKQCSKHPREMVIPPKASTSSSRSVAYFQAQQLVDAELTCIVLQLLSLLDAPANVQLRREHRSNQHLELALIFFMQQFRKVLSILPLAIYPWPSCPGNPGGVLSPSRLDSFGARTDPTSTSSSPSSFSCSSSERYYSFHYWP